MTREIPLTKPVFQGARGRNGVFTVGRLTVQLEQDPDAPWTCTKCGTSVQMEIGGSLIDQTGGDCCPVDNAVHVAPTLVGIRAQSSRQGAQDPIMLYLTPRDALTLLAELKGLLAHLPEGAPLDGYEKPAAASPVELVGGGTHA